MLEATSLHKLYMGAELYIRWQKDNMKFTNAKWNLLMWNYGNHAHPGSIPTTLN